MKYGEVKSIAAFAGGCHSCATFELTLLRKTREPNKGIALKTFGHTDLSKFLVEFSGAKAENIFVTR